MKKVYSADKIFTGTDLLTDTAIVIEDGVVKELVPLSGFPPDIKVVNHYPVMAPALIDIQIYGASSQLFSVYPSVDTLHKMYGHCKLGGTAHFLPTIATSADVVLRKGIDAIRQFWKEGGRGVLGLHIEGPWINKIKKGAHLESLIHSPEVEEVRSLLDYGKGVIKVITLAPEMCSREVIQLIESYGIVISAGHSNATYAEAIAAFDEGISLGTHLFNAMTALHHREPGFAAAVMMHPGVMCSVVPDGLHVNFLMIKLAKKVMGDRLFIITDAVTETTEGPYQHTLNVDKYESNGILSGSALTMIQGVKNLAEKCSIPPAEALRMASLYPAKAIGSDHEIGKIEKGSTDEIILLTGELDLIGFL